MKARTLIPVEVLDGVSPEGIPIFRREEAGFLLDDPECYRLVRNGTAEPADEECEEFCAPFWNRTAKEFLQANYDQICCAHTTGNSLYDSDTGEPEALSRMVGRLSKHKIKFNRNDPVDVMKKHLKLVKQLKGKANERIERQAKEEMSAKVQVSEDSRRRGDDPDANGI
jgi:hypothetical protein